MMSKRSLPAVRWLVAIIALWTSVLIAAPMMIRAAYDQRLGPLNNLLSGRTAHGVEFYLKAWRQLMLAGTGALIVAGLLMLLLFRFRQAINAAIRNGWAALPAVRPADLLTYAAAFAFAGGMVESLRWIIAYFLLHKVTSKAPTLDLLWMTPISALIVLVGFALLVMALGRLSGQHAQRVRGFGALLLCFFTVYSAVSIMPLGIHAIARVVLCLGIATVFVKALRAGRPRILAIGRGSALIGTAAVLVIVIALPVARSVKYRNSFEVAARARRGAPNIILIIWDTVRAASLSLYGYARPTTPNLERLAQNAVVFNRTVSAASWTLPSHASMFTGLYHHQHSAGRNSPLDKSAFTLAEYLRSTGYQTAGFIGNTYWVGSKFGLGQGFSWYEDRPVKSVRSVLVAWHGAELLLARLVTGETVRQVERVPAARSQAALLRWLDDRDTTPPFFIFMNEFDAHEPYLPPSGDFRFSNNTPLHNWSYVTRKRHWSRTELKELNEAYDACIYYLDHQLGKLHDELSRRGLLENTMIIVASDHGETLGEQDPRLLGHANNVYYDVLHVPLVFYWPARIKAPRRVDQLVSLVDLPATLVDMIGSDAVRDSPFPGVSLWPLAFGTGAVTPRPALSQVNPASYHKDFHVMPTSAGSLHSLVGPDGFHYIASARGSELLFDVNKDPWELTNLANTPTGKVLIASYRAELTELVADTVHQTR